ncbi:MAG: hypothetical protein ACQPRI_06130 [Solitalea-like symbiont of Tyrophagus putrescentiae]
MFKKKEKKASSGQTTTTTTTTITKEGRTEGSETATDTLKKQRQHQQQQMVAAEGRRDGRRMRMRGGKILAATAMLPFAEQPTTLWSTSICNLPRQWQPGGFSLSLSFSLSRSLSKRLCDDKQDVKTFPMKTTLTAITTANCKVQQTAV